MSLITEVLGTVVPVFGVIVIGYAFAAVKKIDLSPIIDLLLYLTIPALVISALCKMVISPAELLRVSTAACIVVGGSWILGHLYLRISKKKKLKGLLLPTMFMNSGNLPFPLALLAFGAAGLQVAVLYYIAISLLVYTVGIYMAKGSGGIKEIIRLPLIYATIIGLAINLGGFTVPGPVLTTFDMLGAATIPLMQLSLGYYLFSIKITEFWTSLSASVIRIGGGFSFGLLAVTLLHMEGTTRAVVLLSSAMPSAVITFIMGYKYKVNSELIASVVALSTFISAVTIPIMLYWLL